MAFMKRDVNMGLLFLIIAALLMFSGFTVYYQTTFKNVSKSYEIKLSELQKVTSELESKKGLLNETSVQLMLRKQQEAALSEQFTDVRGEKEQLEADKAKLELELASTKSTLASTQTELDSTKVKLVAKEQQFISLNAQYNNCKEDRDEYKEQRDDCLNG